MGYSADEKPLYSAARVKMSFAFTQYTDLEAVTNRFNHIQFFAGKTAERR